VDRERLCLRLPDSKTGAKTVHLNAAALEVLESIPKREGNPWVIPGSKAGSHLVNIEKPWRRLREKAGIADVRLHDLRHNFASVGAAAGLGLPILGALLTHKDAATTQRYAHLAADPLKAANEVIGQKMAKAMGGTK